MAVRTRPAKPPVGQAPASHVEVAVVGGGVAGLTSALRLAQCGFQVTIYESQAELGGNLSSQTIEGVDYDVYPHIYAEWYANFWSILETDLGLKRDEHFTRHMSFKLLKKGEASYQEVFNATTVQTAWHNLTSGVLPVPDLFLMSFYALDLASHPFDQMSMLSRLTVNGHLYSRGYATERVADFGNYVLQLIWSIPSDRTSAPAYADFVKHALQFPRPTPFAWMLNGSIQSEILGPLTRKLETLGCDIRLNTAVERIRLEGDDALITLEGGETVQADYAVLAVPAPVLTRLVMQGPKGGRIVDRVPHLSELAQLSGESIAVVNLYFKNRLTDIPTEIVGLRDNALNLSFVDISQLWTVYREPSRPTVLVLACSNVNALPTPDPHERGFTMIQTLHDYLPVFEPGAHWGDQTSNIDWAKTRYVPNETRKLYINEVGDELGAPLPGYDELSNVFFAGDFCRTDVQMATIEAAVQSGVQAARSLQARSPRGAPIQMIPHTVYSVATLLSAKLALLPFAYAASAWSAIIDPRSRIPEGQQPLNAYSPLTGALVLPAAYTLDWWKTFYWLAKQVLIKPSPEGAGDGGATDPDLPPDDLPALTLQALAQTGELVRTLAAHAVEQREGPVAHAALAKLAGAAGSAQQVWGRIWARYQANRASAEAATAGSGPYRRRWRVKP